MIVFVVTAADVISFIGFIFRSLLLLALVAAVPIGIAVWREHLEKRRAERKEKRIQREAERLENSRWKAQRRSTRELVRSRERMERARAAEQRRRVLKCRFWGRVEHIWCWICRIDDAIDLSGTIGDLLREEKQHGNLYRLFRGFADRVRWRLRYYGRFA